MLKRPWLTGRFGNVTQQTKLRQGGTVPSFSLCYPAKLWEDEKCNSWRSMLPEERELPTSQGMESQTRSASAMTTFTISRANAGRSSSKIGKR